jgi:thymidylate synthase (FAD)
MSVRLIWITPNAESLIVHMARVSNPVSQASAQDPERLIVFLIRERHWSPFEMAHACVEIETTRDIGRQILRHRSFSFQEFSQRYASTDALERPALREARMQHPTNRQSSLKRIASR